KRAPSRRRRHRGRITSARHSTGITNRFMKTNELASILFSAARRRRRLRRDQQACKARQEVRLRPILLRYLQNGPNPHMQTFACFCLADALKQPSAENAAIHCRPQILLFSGKNSLVAYWADSQFTIHGIPNLSTSMPKPFAQNVSANGMT